MKNIIGKTWNILFSQNGPVSIVHFITNRCNARCPHCFIDFDNQEEQKSSMPIEDIDQLTKTVGSQLMNVNLTGGEPFLRRDIIDIARCYCSNTLIDSIFISTHGGLTEKVLDFANTIKREFPGIKLIFSISIDHFSTQHNEYRKIKNLFKNALATHRELGRIGSGSNIFTNIGITVSPFNHSITLELYESLKKEHGVKAFTATLVRDEGVYRTPLEMKSKLIKSYGELTKKIQQDIKSRVIDGFNPDIFLGRMMNKKEEIMTKNIERTYVDNEFISPCRSGALFGILYPNGDVFPCEILHNKKMGNVYDYGLNFSNLWKSAQAQKTKRWIVESKCRCTYECAWSYNILGNKKYLSKMARAMLSRHL